MNALIRWALSHRLLVLCLALATLGFGVPPLQGLPIDIFPDLTRPRVTILTECPGLSPEEVETLVTVPLETAVNGASGVEAVRSASGLGLSVVYVEFGWSTDVYRARQTVAERLTTVARGLPEGVRPELAPVSSILGQFLLIGVSSRDGTTSPRELRTLADWVLRPRLQSLPGIAQVVALGGERRQWQVLVDPGRLTAHGVSLQEVEAALRLSNQNASGGFVDQGPLEFVVRGLGRAQSPADLEDAVVQARTGRSLQLRDVARVVEGAQIKRGDASVNGQPAVVLTLIRQAHGDTRQLTANVLAALDEIQPTLPADVVIDHDLYQQREFIDRGIENVVDALRDGALLVLVVLFLFLLNERITGITLTAIPLSIVLAALVFRLSGMSINVMTLGGLAVALGELVDDAIVDIENVDRRLRLNAALALPRPPLTVIYEASVEVRQSIVFGTLLVILVFFPLFGLSGMEGRLFAPLGVAYIVSLLASLLVSLTVTPALASWLLTGRKADPRHSRDAFLLRWLKTLATPVVRFSLHPAGLAAVLVIVAAAVAGSAVLLTRLGSDFLPPFDEGVAQVNVMLPPGSSLAASNEVGRMVDAAFQRQQQTAARPHGLVASWVRRTGRAELDEHAEGVHWSEFIVRMNPDSGVSRADALATLRQELEEIPGIEYEVEQPLTHLISHMLSGVAAQLAIKIYGDDLDVLRRLANEVQHAVAEVPGLAPPVVEPQTVIPQLRITLDREQLAAYGLTVGGVNQFLETALQGRVVSTILDGQRTFDLVVRLDDPYREDFEQIGRLSIGLPNGGRIPLSTIARLEEGGGPNIIQRDHVRRRIAIRANATDRDLGSVVADVRQAVAARVTLPTGYRIEYSGQFEAQQQATRRILLLSLAALAGVFLVLYTLFPSVRIVLQILLALPIAYVGGTLALWLTGQSLSVASLVGFISLGGIAARNGILLVAHYRHLMQHEGEGFTPEMIVRGSLERLAPVLMTALTAGLGLLPLVLGGHQPGKEILYPVATVILGGLCTSTLCEYLVHPGLFYRFSGGDAEKLARGSASGVEDVAV